MARLQFLTDENVSPRVVRALRQVGYEVLDLKEANRLGWPDDRVLAWATAKRCVVVTHDKDFAELLKHPLARRHAGVILLRLHDQHPVRVIVKLLPVLARLRSRRLQNALVIIGEESIEYLRG